MIGTNSQTGGLSYNVYSYPEGEYLIGKNGLLNPNAKLGRIVNGYYLTPDNWVDAVYHTALRQEYNVNISGGSDKAQIYASFGYLDEDGIAEGSDYSRITGRLKTSVIHIQYRIQPLAVLAKLSIQLPYIHFTYVIQMVRSCRIKMVTCTISEYPTKVL